jgi:hypothetical protein
MRATAPTPGLRAELEARGVGYVLAVACDHPVRVGGTACRADALLSKVPARAWQQVSCGPGAKGHRWYDWAFCRLDDGDPAGGGQAAQRWLLVRRHQRTGELVFYRWATLAMLAHAFLVVAAVTDQARDPAPSGRTRLTCNEVQHLFAALVAVPVADTGHRWRWSLWRRRHQACARTCHYQRQAA